MPSNIDQARALLAAALEMQVADVTPDSSITTLEQWDSLAHMRLVMLLEKTLNASLPVDDILSIDDVKGIARILSNEGAAGA